MAAELPTSVPPALAARVFGDRLPLAIRYAQWLAGPGVERGLVGPREAERVWERHLLNCVAVAALVQPGMQVIDIGSGAGLPGLVVAIARPDLRIVLVESMLRRTVFLEEVVADLRLDSVEVVRARAEELDRRADVVTARAVAPLDRLAIWAARFLRDDGVVLALKGSSAAEEVEAAWPALRRARLADHVELLALVPDDGSDASLVSGIGVRREGFWEGAGAKPQFVSENYVSDDDRLALVVRLHRFPQGVSRTAPSGLG